jgi:hypothetical protein
MSEKFSGLDAFNIRDHGDNRERDSWNTVAGPLSEYESFWRALVVLLTNRIDPGISAGSEWMRLRPSIPIEYEKLAMHNYSVLYYLATARRVISENGMRLASGGHPLPEQTFLALQAAVEQTKTLKSCAVRILVGLGLRPKIIPKRPEALYRTIGAYRNALTHDPVLGRAVSHGRELLPPENLLPKQGKPLLWRDAAKIPTNKMVDGLQLENELWQRFAESVQELWSALAQEFVLARAVDKFRAELGLSSLLPIRRPIEPASVHGPISVSGFISARSDVH